MNMTKRKGKIFAKTAKQTIKELIIEADKVFSKDKKLANRYVTLARKVAMKNNIKIPSNLQKKFCKHCYSFLKPGINLRVRTTGKTISYYCLECKKFMRFPYKH